MSDRAEPIQVNLHRGARAAIVLFDGDEATVYWESFRPGDDSSPLDSLSDMQLAAWAARLRVLAQHLDRELHERRTTSRQS